MQNRRDFLKRASLMLAGGVIAPQVFSAGIESSSAATAASTKKIGLQLYSLRELVKDEGIQHTLEVVAKMGYKNLEIASYDNGKMYGVAPGELEKMINDLGMRCTSTHLSRAYNKAEDAEIMAWWDRAIEAHNELGVKYMIQPWMPVNDNTTLDDIKMYCDYFTSVGYKTAAASMSFGYHNHDFEFKTIDGQVIYDVMLQNVSKNHVLFELDVYWAAHAGADPVAYMKKYADQIRVLHIKDEKEIGASGQIDFEPIFNQMYENNIKDWYVEVEQYTNNDPEASVQESFNFLNNAAYVK